MRLGLVSIVVAAFIMTTRVVAVGQKALFRNDAEFYWLVALDPFGEGTVFIPFAEEMGRAYRYGRILFPFLGWLFAGGRDSLVPWALMAVDVVAFGVTVALAIELCARRGAAGRGIAVLLVPAMWFALVLAVSEPLVFALVFGVYLLWLTGWRRAALVTAAFLLLAREAAVVALVPLIVRDVRERGAAVLASWALVPVPLIAWWTYVRVRVGEWPFFDDSISRREALGAPLSGVVTIAREDVDADHIVAFLLGAVTVAAGVWVYRRRPFWPVSEGALAFSLMLLVLGPNAWRYPGEAIRLMGPAQLLIAIAVAAHAPVRRGHRPTFPSR